MAGSRLHCGSNACAVSGDVGVAVVSGGVGIAVAWASGKRRVARVSGLRAQLVAVRDGVVHAAREHVHDDRLHAAVQVVACAVVALAERVSVIRLLRSKVVSEEVCTDSRVRSVLVVALGACACSALRDEVWRAHSALLAAHGESCSSIGGVGRAVA